MFSNSAMMDFRQSPFTKLETTNNQDLPDRIQKSIMHHNLQVLPMKLDAVDAGDE